MALTPTLAALGAKFAGMQSDAEAEDPMASEAGGQSLPWAPGGARATAFLCLALLCPPAGARERALRRVQAA